MKELNKAYTCIHLMSSPEQENITFYIAVFVARKNQIKCLGATMVLNLRKHVFLDYLFSNRYFLYIASDL